VGGFVDSDMWTLGVNYKATQSLTFGVQYWTVKESVGPSSRSKLLVLNADYALSKRTFLYALFGYTDTEDLGIAPLWGNGNFAGASNTIVSNDKNNGLALGIRHVF
jgi:predicted porin